MRIAFLTEVFLPKIDGITNRLRHTIDQLVDQGHEAIVFGPLHAQGSYRGVKVVQIPGLPFRPYPDLQLSYADPRIVTRLAAFAPDVVHAVGPASLGVLGMVAARLLGLPIVASYHTDLPAYLPRYGLDFAAPLIWPALRAIHNAADVNLCPSSRTRRQLAENGIRDVGLWRGGVDTARFRPEAATTGMRERLAGTDRLQEVRAIGLYVGRVSPEKNLERLFDLHDAVPGLHLAVVGDGPDRDRLERKASGRRIRFTGFLRGQDLAAAYASADFFYMPSTTETLGFVVLEAMSAGTPAVAAAAGGQLDLVSHGENGLLFDAAVEGDDVKQVRRLLDRPSQRKHFARQARKFAEAGSWAEETRRLVAVYRDAIEVAGRTDRVMRLRNTL